MTIEDDPFLKHASLIFIQEGCTVEQARFKAWCEGPDGYAKRLEHEHQIQQQEE